MGIIEEIAKKLESNKKILVASHIIPDGDCIGSTVALGLALKNLNKEVIMVNGDEVPDMYKFLKGSEDILPPSSVEKVPDITVLVDCTDLSRVGEELQKKIDKNTFIINIDHHVSNLNFGDLNFVRPEAAAAGELIHALLQEMKIEITPEIATALYTAIVTDTGSFQYENTSPKTLRLAAELHEKGANVTLVREYLWERKPVLGILALKEVLSTLSFDKNGKIAWISLDKELYDRLGLTPECCEGLINYPRSIEGVEVALFFKEQEDGKVKVGLRSKNYINVNEIASQFGGGGHQRSAGCIVEGPLREAIDKVVSFIKKML